MSKHKKGKKGYRPRAVVLDEILKPCESEAGDRQRAIAMEIEEWMKKVNPYPELNGDQLRDLREIVQRLWSDE